jgi:hypothetical protein
VHKRVAAGIAKMPILARADLISVITSFFELFIYYPQGIVLSREMLNSS